MALISEMVTILTTPKQIKRIVIIKTYQTTSLSFFTSKQINDGDQNLPNIIIRSKQVNVYITFQTTSLSNVRSKHFQNKKMNVYHQNLPNNILCNFTSTLN
jgi:hypothetical protein